MTAPATRVFMVRHGATVLSAEDRFAGASDIELSEEGRQQAQCLSQRLRHEKIAAVYASPMGRTVETARILAAPHDIQVQTRDGFREISHGHWEGMKRRDVEEKFPQEIAEWEKDPYTFAPPGGESGLDVTPLSHSQTALSSQISLTTCRVRLSSQRLATTLASKLF